MNLGKRKLAAQLVVCTGLALACVGERGARWSEGGLDGAIGAVGAADVDGYMSRQAAELRVRVEPLGFGVMRSGDEIHLLLGTALAFEMNSDQLRGGAADGLAALALVLGEYDRTLIEVRGHADCTRDARDRMLAQRRAARIERDLRERQIHALRLSARAVCTPLAPSRGERERHLRNAPLEIRISPPPMADQDGGLARPTPVLVASEPD